MCQGGGVENYRRVVEWRARNMGGKPGYRVKSPDKVEKKTGKK